MYGYHENEELFLKIYLYNPAHVKRWVRVKLTLDSCSCSYSHTVFASHRLSELLSAGVLKDGILQPHEAHIPFVLQFMIDYNLYGMNFIHFSSIKFRSGGRGKRVRGLIQQSYYPNTTLPLLCYPTTLPCYPTNLPSYPTLLPYYPTLLPYPATLPTYYPTLLPYYPTLLPYYPTTLPYYPATLTLP